MRWTCSAAAAVAAMTIALAPAPARADSISAVENARAKARQGAYLSRQDREALRRYGGNDDWGYGPRYGYWPDGYAGGYDDDYDDDDDGPVVEFGFYGD